ncbi:hypothetical protein BBJ28_00021621 [Nothophytophthora sp. Chile5]|nr:hypothetical protein BBJ28_00021621 [Nothophytophthora sp. Chile5]
MERSAGGKRPQKLDDEAPIERSEDEELEVGKATAVGDAIPLMQHGRVPGHPMSPPSLTPRRGAVWALAGLGALFLLLVVLVVRGGTLHAPPSYGDQSSASDWIDLLPSDVAKHVDRSVDPCDDFYAFSCGQWLERAKIPDDKASVYLSFTTVGDENERVLRDVLQQDWPLVGELYASCMNFSNSSSTTADAASTAVLAPTLQAISATKSKKELFVLAGKLSQTGPDFLTGIGVYADAREATKYALYASQAGLTLPDPQYYLDRDQFDTVSDALHAYVVELFVLAGWASDAAASHAAAVIAFEQLLAPLFVPKEELQDPVASYNRMSVAQAATKYPLLFAQYLNGTGLLTGLTARKADVIVETPTFFQQTEALVTADSVTLETLQSVLSYQYLSSWAPALSEPFVQASFAFFARTLRGQQARAPRWKVCLSRVTGSFPDLMGKYFALLRFDEASEELANRLVTQLQTALRQNLARVDWLDGSTRQAALEKLGQMSNLIGHSTRAEHFPFELNRDAPLAENLRIVKQFNFERVVKRIGETVDRSEWLMTSAAVNAYYQPTGNQIVFPAGILQPPFFARGRHAARNFGAIGSVIGHELTHGFDDSGRFYAGDGNLADWWSNATVKEFTQRTQCLVDQYAAYPAVSAFDKSKVLGHINGNFTLGENIADNGGVKLAFAAYQAYVQELGQRSEADVANQAERDLPARAADKLFFLSFAQAFCAKSSDASMVQRLATDPHSPERWRINGVASNSRDFARVFSCPADTPMNPRTKCQLW